MEVQKYFSLVLVLNIFKLFKVCEGVRLLDDSVIPPHALKGHQAVLRCNYDLEGDDLYSVKWYFNQKEFYRYIPTDNPKVTIFNHHAGVKVNARLSTEREVVLDNVDFTTTGQYRCEVSGDAPMFQTASTEGILYVVDLPDQGPDIMGGLPRYNIGDRVNVTCVSHNSMPAAQLQWYINGEKADPVHIKTYEPISMRGLLTSRLGLSFKVRHKHFQRGDLKLKCTATISTVYWKSNEESVQGSGFNAHTAPVSESKGRTSAATSHITGDNLYDNSDEIPYIPYDGGNYGPGRTNNASSLFIIQSSFIHIVTLMALWFLVLFRLQGHR